MPAQHHGHRKAKRRLRAGATYLAFTVMGMTLGALLLAYVLAGDIYEYQDSVDGTHLPQVDAIVCLSGGRGRISAAADTWFRYWELAQRPHPAGATPLPLPLLYISGMGHQSTWTVFARQLRRGVLEVIKPDNVIIETESENTDANARWVARQAELHGWHRILLMTSRYHMRRARFMFERVLVAPDKPFLIETMSVYQEPFEPGEWRTSPHGIRVTLVEYFKWIYYKYFWTP